MSETDSFIQEVTEEVRQDRMFALWKKWGPLVLGGVAVIVGGAAYWSWSQSEQRAAAEARGGTFLAAEEGNVEHATALPGKIEGPARLIAELTAAGALAQAGDIAEAVTRYEAIAGDPALSIDYTDLASLQALRLKAASGEAAGLIEALEPLSGPTRPYRLLALELRAALRAQSGDTEGAHADLNAILTDPATTTGLRQRAAAALTATGGTFTDPSG